jgi:hypothetical protein
VVEGVEVESEVEFERGFFGEAPDGMVSSFTGYERVTAPRARGWRAVVEKAR